MKNEETRFALRSSALVIAMFGLAIGLAAVAANFFASAEATEPDRSVVTVVDRSEGWTDLQPIMDEWNKSTLTLRQAAECPEAGYCVVITRPAWYNADWMGWWTPVTVDRSTILLSASDERNHSPKARAWIMCHELGHALFGSLDQRPGGKACAVDDWTEGPRKPTGRDLALLERVSDAGTAEWGTALHYAGKGA